MGSTSEYEILGKLASGGMADIYLARVRALGVQRYVVMKRILESHRDDPEFVQMFLEEARLAARLQHPNIAQFHDLGEINGAYFYTMEYIHGLTVGDIGERVYMGQPLEIEHLLLIASGVTAALHHAHTRVDDDRRPLHIVHRDVTPVNIMVSFEGAVKLIDFGVAKASNRDIRTEAGIVKGKVAYLSPEQIAGAPIDGRSDLFSLGICLYELLTLRRLFLRENEVASILAIRDEPIAPPSMYRPIPPALDRFIMRALAKNPTDRFASAQDMHEAVEQVAHELGLRLSAGALSRRVRGLGERPEPWVGLDIRPVTVTRASLPDRPEMSAPRPVSRDMETKLGSLPRLPANPYAAAEQEMATTLPFTAKRSQVNVAPEHLPRAKRPSSALLPARTRPSQTGAPPVAPTEIFTNDQPLPPRRPTPSPTGAPPVPPTQMYTPDQRSRPSQTGAPPVPPTQMYTPDQLQPPRSRPSQTGAPPVPPTEIFTNDQPLPPHRPSSMPRPGPAELPPTMMLSTDPAGNNEPTRFTPNPLETISPGPAPVVIPQAGPATMAIVLASPAVQAYAASRAPRAPFMSRQRLIAIIAGVTAACIAGGIVLAVC